jgi:hypothetical protein
MNRFAVRRADTPMAISFTLKETLEIYRQAVRETNHIVASAKSIGQAGLDKIPAATITM